MLEYKGYIGTVDAEDGAFHGRVAGLRDVVTFEGSTYEEVTAAFHGSVDGYLAFCRELGEKPDKTFSGKIALRLAPDIHRLAAIKAGCEGVSLNQWIARRIESAA